MPSEENCSASACVLFRFATGDKKTLEVDVVIGADGANSRVAKEIEAGDYEYAIAFQERMKIPDEKMKWYVLTKHAPPPGV
eukprot:3717471-Amphidinium_carterae.1